jgi:hypothetical protein
LRCLLAEEAEEEQRLALEAMVGGPSSGGSDSDEAEWHSPSEDSDAWMDGSSARGGQLASGSKGPRRGKRVRGDSGESDSESESVG